MIAGTLAGNPISLERRDAKPANDFFPRRRGVAEIDEAKATGMREQVPNRYRLFPLAANSGMCSDTGSSSCNRPRSYSCITAIAAIGLPDESQSMSVSGRMTVAARSEVSAEPVPVRRRTPTSMVQYRQLSADVQSRSHPVGNKLRSPRKSLGKLDDCWRFVHQTTAESNVNYGDNARLCRGGISATIIPVGGRKLRVNLTFQHGLRLECENCDAVRQFALLCISSPLCLRRASHADEANFVRSFAVPQHPELEGSVHDLSDALVFSVATRWMTAQGDDQKKLTSTIAQWLVREHANELPWIDLRWNEKRRVDLTRYRVYKIVREAVDRGFVQLNPPQAVQRARTSTANTGSNSKRNEIRVVDVTEDVVNDMVARATAETALSLDQKARGAKRRRREARRQGGSRCGADRYRSGRGLQFVGRHLVLGEAT